MQEKVQRQIQRNRVEIVGLLQRRQQAILFPKDQAISRMERKGVAAGHHGQKTWKTVRERFPIQRRLRLSRLSPYKQPD